MKFILGALLALTSTFSVASTGTCIIEGYAQKSYGSAEVYRFMRQVEKTTLAGCELKLQRVSRALEQCLMIPAGEVSHVQMSFDGQTKVKNAVFVTANCPEQQF